MSSDFNKNKKSKQKRFNTTSTKFATSKKSRLSPEDKTAESSIPLQAKDSEWIDILKSKQLDQLGSSTNASVKEEMLQIAECEDEEQIKPLAILFPGLLNEDPQTLNGMLNKTMSTTEVTKHLVNLGEKANFTFMKKADRLIPRDKKWLESLTERSISYCSTTSGSITESLSSNYEVTKDTENVTTNSKNIYALETSNKANPVLCIQNEDKIQNGANANEQVEEVESYRSFK